MDKEIQQQLEDAVEGIYLARRYAPNKLIAETEVARLREEIERLSALADQPVTGGSTKPR